MRLCTAAALMLLPAAVLGAPRAVEPLPGGRAAAWAPALGPLLKTMSQAAPDNSLLARLSSLDLSAGQDIRRLNALIRGLRAQGIASPEPLLDANSARSAALVRKALDFALAQARRDAGSVLAPADGRKAPELEPERAVEIAERSLLEDGAFLDEALLKRLAERLPKLYEARDVARKMRALSQTLDERVLDTAGSWNAGGETSFEVPVRFVGSDPGAPADGQSLGFSMLMRGEHGRDLERYALAGDDLQFETALYRGTHALKVRRAELQRRGQGPQAARQWAFFDAEASLFFGRARELEQRFPAVRVHLGPITKVDQVYLEFSGLDTSRMPEKARRRLARVLPSAWRLERFRAGDRPRRLPSAFLKVLRYYEKHPRSTPEEAERADLLLDRGAGPLPSAAELGKLGPDVSSRMFPGPRLRWLFWSNVVASAIVGAITLVHAQWLTGLALGAACCLLIWVTRRPTRVLYARETLQSARGRP